MLEVSHAERAATALTAKQTSLKVSTALAMLSAAINLPQKMAFVGHYEGAKALPNFYLAVILAKARI